MAERKDKQVRNKLRDALSVTEPDMVEEQKQGASTGKESSIDVIKWSSDNVDDDSEDQSSRYDSNKPFVSIVGLDSRTSQNGDGDPQMKFEPRVVANSTKANSNNKAAVDLHPKVMKSSARNKVLPLDSFQTAAVA